MEFSYPNIITALRSFRLQYLADNRQEKATAKRPRRCRSAYVLAQIRFKTMASWPKPHTLTIVPLSVGAHIGTTAFSILLFEPLAPSLSLALALRRVLEPRLESE